MTGRDSGSQNGEPPERWNESEKWNDRERERDRRGPRDVRREEDYEPPAPRNDRWKEPEPRAEERSNSRWPSDDVRRTRSRKDEVDLPIHDVEMFKRICNLKPKIYNINTFCCRMIGQYRYLAMNDRNYCCSALATPGSISPNTRIYRLRPAETAYQTASPVYVLKINKRHLNRKYIKH